MPPIVELKNISFAYNGTSVLSNIDFTVQTNDFLALIGPNGPYKPIGPWPPKKHSPSPSPNPEPFGGARATENTSSELLVAPFNRFLVVFSAIDFRPRF